MSTTYNQAITAAFESQPIPSPLDLDAIVRASFADYGDDNGWGNNDAHVSDIVGLCDREVWARRYSAVYKSQEERGMTILPREPINTEAAIAMELGHVAEAVLLDRMEKHLPEGWTMVRQQKVYLTISPVDGHLFSLLEHPDLYAGPETWVHEHDGKWAVGHIDAWLVNIDLRLSLVFDAKSTVWWNKNENGKQVWYPKDKLGRKSHRLQVATYALGVAASAAGLLELDLGGKGRNVVWYDPQPFLELAERRLIAVLNNTDPKNDEPDVLPNEWTFINAQRGQDGRITGGTSWACGYVDRSGNVKPGYCRHSTCERHSANIQAEF